MEVIAASSFAERLRGLQLERDALVFDVWLEGGAGELAQGLGQHVQLEREVSTGGLTGIEELSYRWVR